MKINAFVFDGEFELLERRLEEPYDLFVVVRTEEFSWDEQPDNVHIVTVDLPPDLPDEDREGYLNEVISIELGYVAGPDDEVSLEELNGA